LRQVLEIRHIACRLGTAKRSSVTGALGGFVTMAQLLDRDALQSQGRGEREKAIKILAKSIYRELRQSGYDTREIVALSSELIGLITTDIKPDTASK
jgi:hypothetical protein